MKLQLRRWIGLALLSLAPGGRAAALPELLALQQTFTAGQAQPITIPSSPVPQTVGPAGRVVVPVPVGSGRPQAGQVPGIEGIIGGAGEMRPGGFVDPVEPAEQAEPQQQAPPPQPQAQPAGPVVSRIEASGPGLMLLFDNAPLNTVINLIMKELGYTYMIDPAVQGTVNIQTTQPVKREDLFPTLELILKLNNAAIVKAGQIYLIIPIAEGIRAPHLILLELEKTTSAIAPGQTPPPAPAPAGPPGTTVLEEDRGLVTVIIPLQYIPSSEMTTIIQPFMSGGAVVLSYDSKNILILTDFRSNIEKVKKLIDVLDTRFFDLNTIELIPIRFNQAAEVAADLTKVFGGGGDATSINLIPIERLNSILVVTHSERTLEEVKRWVTKLDTASGGMNLQTFVYQVENSTAGNIADILVQLYSDGSGLPSQGMAEGQVPGQQAVPAQGTPAAPARTPAGTLQQQQQQQQQGLRPVTAGSRTSSRSSLGPSLEGRPISERAGAGAGSLMGGNIKIIVNEFNNSIIVQATEADYQYIERAIRQLDVLPRQVMIEAKVYAVELRDDLSFGIAAFLEARGQGLATTSSITQPQGQSPGGALVANTRFIIGEARQLQATLNALQDKTNVKLLEAPRLMAIDGQQATINIGAEVPVTTSSFGDPVVSGSAGAFLNQIQFRPTGTSLLINPRISASGIVTMDLAIEVSQAVGSGLTPTINRNYVETSLIVKDGHTIAIGGIISESLSVSRHRIPLLGDLPIIGALFGQTARNDRRTELIVLITPHVVGTIAEADVTTDDMQRALQRSYGYIREKNVEEAERINRRRQSEVLEETKRQERLQKLEEQIRQREEELKKQGVQ